MAHKVFSDAGWNIRSVERSTSQRMFVLLRTVNEKTNRMRLQQTVTRKNCLYPVKMNGKKCPTLLQIFWERAVLNGKQIRQKSRFIDVTFIHWKSYFIFQWPLFHLLSLFSRQSTELLYKPIIESFHGLSFVFAATNCCRDKPQ